ncbi:MAG: hypothetical protein KIT60_21055 [Burkholderiaceae bacterium]|nr:hypothetical protein [Burkholderiaceae bacterium]
MNKSLSAASLLACALWGTGAAHAQAPATSASESRQIAVVDYAVFVDPPTGFVFVKLPRGWKFAGKIEPEDVARLPSHVFTALLKPEPQEAAGDKMGMRTR